MNKISRFIDNHQDLLFMMSSIIAALLFGGIFILFAGANPIVAYTAMIQGSLGSTYAIADTINNAIPLILTGLALTVSSKVGIFNIGAEGQLQIGALCALLVGVFVQAPVIIHTLLALLAAIIGGSIWAFIAAYLKERRGVNVVISAIMLNYLAINLVQYLINNFLKDNGLDVATKKIHNTAWLFYIIPMPYGVTTSIIYVAIVVIFVYILLNKTVFGYKIKAVGQNKDAAKYAGMNVKFLALIGLIISGALAGLGGGLEILGRQHRLVAGFSPGYGYSGIPISLLARNNPIGVVFSGLFFSMLTTGAVEMQQNNISTEVIYIIQGLVVLFIASQFAMKYFYSKIKIKKAGV